MTATEADAEEVYKNQFERQIRDECLGGIFRWDPSWLDDEKYNDEPPAIAAFDKITPTSLSYDTFDDYCQVMLPLWANELWYLLKNGSADDEQFRIQNKIIEGTVNPNSVEYSSFNDAANCTIFYFDLKITSTSQQSYPVRSDLVKFKYPRDGATEMFAYVEQLSRRQLKDDRVQLIYTLATRPFVIKWPCSLQLTTVISMSSHLTLIDSLQYLPKSSLFASVLLPNVEDYEMSTLVDINSFPIITGDNLNAKQLESVERIRKTVEDGKIGISLIQGPPGTGKSQVIVNAIASMIIARIVPRILVCAPSNKAIDEVVLRLLEIQKIFYRNGIRFNVVRVGQEDKMHESAKKISPSTLAFESLAHSSTNVSNEKQSKEETRIIEEADVIASTLTSCCSNQMKTIFGQKGLEISVCIVDEAAQATELTTLIPLMLGVNTLILVGDPQQLRPTVLSPKAREFKFDRSLFARAQEIFDSQPENPILILDTQYRMIDSIAQWPNRYFYKGILQNGANIEPLRFCNYLFLNHTSSQDEGNQSNRGEANLIVNLIHTMMTQSKLQDLTSEINLGIITPYQKQRQLLESLLRSHLAGVSEEIRSKFKVTEVNTVDSFQGSERDIIVISCVRSAGIGFINDPNRLCVSLTRAKHSLIVCGNFNTFKQNLMWRDLLNDANSRGVYVNIDHNAEATLLKEYLIVDE